MKLVAPIAAFLLAIPAFGDGVQFQSRTTTKARSPDGNWWVVCKCLSKSEGELNHCLLLNSKVGTFELYRFDRACDVLWSPDSSHLAITDWLGSNLSDVLVLLPHDKPKSRSLRDLFPSGAIPRAEIAGHCYFEANRWLDAHRLLIRIFGHADSGDFHEFDYKWVFDLRSKRFEQNGTKTPNKPHAARSRSAGRGKFGNWQMAVVAAPVR